MFKQLATTCGLVLMAGSLVCAAQAPGPAATAPAATPAAAAAKGATDAPKPSAASTPSKKHTRHHKKHGGATTRPKSVTPKQ
jgi:hypothetical protein